MTSAFQQTLQKQVSQLPNYEALKDSFKHMPAWVLALKETAASHFVWPGADWEAWRYTPLRALAKEDFMPAQKASGNLDLPRNEENYRLVFINGLFDQSLSDTIPGLDFCNTAQALETQEAKEIFPHVGELADYPMLALATSCFQDGLFLHLSQSPDKPIEVILYTENGTHSCPRSLILLKKNVEAKIILREIGQGKYFSSPVTDIVLEDLAKLELYRFQSESISAFNLHTILLAQHAKASFEGFTLNTGARLARLDLRAQLLGKEISCKIRGVYMLRGDQVGDSTLLIDHFEAQGESLQKFKGVIDAQARAIFQGKIQVHRHAQKTNGYQLNNALLLSGDAQSDSKPELEIYADDVKCSHGAATGRLDDDALYYMRARGIPLEAARQLLIKSFLSEDFATLPDRAIAKECEVMVDSWLGQAA